MNCLNKIMAVMLSLLLFVLSCSVVSAEDIYVAADPYVYDHGVAGDGYDGPKYQYFSPYLTDYVYDNVASYIQCNVFSLYNTVSGEVVPAYCTDIKIGAYNGNKYRRLNLEDSTYASTVAGHLRAIVRNGFYLVPSPNESMEEHEIRVNAKLKSIGDAAGVTDLTIGEAISATQIAIWRTAHGSRLEFTDFFRTIYTTKMPSLTKYYDLCHEERINGHVNYTTSTYGQVILDSENEAWINSRIQAVYEYLMSLDPIPASQLVVSPYSFTALNKPVVTQNTNGTFDVTVTASVNVHMEMGDNLTLSAVLDDTHFNSTELIDGEQTVSLTISGVSEELAYNDVTLAIDGNQTITDVVLYEALGGRDTSQSMIGADYSRTPVHAQVIASDSRILNFYKTSLVSSADGSQKRVPLEGIVFDIYFVADMQDYISGNVVLPEPEQYTTSGRADFTIATDSSGRGSINFTQHGYPDGVYLVIEREHPAIISPIEPFYVVLPRTDSDGLYEYEVTVQPKNDVKGSVYIDKDIGSLGTNGASADAYSKNSWIITTNIPEDISNGKSFVITDIFDNRLDYVGNLIVNIENSDGSEVFYSLVENSDYILTVNDVDSLAEDKPSDSMKIELTHEGMSQIAQVIGSNNYSDYIFRIHVDTQINANAEMGNEIPNSAVIKYVNSVNFEFEVESDKTVVYTGGVNLLKVDSKNPNKHLSGAEFELYRVATAEEIASNVDGITNISGVVAPVIKVSFFDNPAMHGDKVTSVTSNENGEVAIYGIAYGNYYLVETKAPDGYNLMGNANEITINELSHTYENVIVIENVGGAVMPHTGGIGTTVFTVSGIILMLVAGILLVLNNCKEKQF